MLARAVARGESRFAAHGLLGVKTGRAGVGMRGGQKYPLQ
jgi:hypothetical protein